MQAVFIRHKMTSTPDILKDLWSKRLIAVHYADIPSTNPQDYEKAGRQALKRLWDYCSLGAVVGATFTTIKRTEMLVGEITKGAQVKITEYDGLIYKTVQLENVCEISFRDYPVLWAIRPRQATVTGWASAQRYLEAILNRENLPRIVSSLAPSQLEVICQEYLRIKGYLHALILPIGRTLPDIDIYGIDEHGGTIIGQVTQSRNPAEISKKLARLKSYQDKETKLVFFGPKSQLVEDISIEYVAVEDVFLEIDRMDSQIISKMLRYQ